MDLQPLFSHYYPDGFKGGECGVFAHKLVNFPPVGDSFTSKKAVVKKLGTLGHDCQVGDVIILDVGTKFGHVAIINSNIMTHWRLTESNWNNDGIVHHTRLLSKNSPAIVGYFRGSLKVETITNMINSKVSLYKNNISNPDIISQGIDFLNNKIKLATNGEFNLITNIFTTDKHFDQIPTEKPNQVMVNPEQILQLPIDGVVTCLVHNVPEVTNPFQAAIQKDGATPIQIPENWFTTFPEAFAEFYMHELMHAFCYLTGQPDKVHTPGPDWGGYIHPVDYYISLLLEIKPFWHMLAGESNNMPQIKLVDIDGEQGIFLAAADMNDLTVICKMFGKDKTKVEVKAKKV